MRANNWPRLLATYLRLRKSRPFQWGKHDCCLFWCNWGKLLTGVDAAAEFRGTYDSELSAARVLKEYGGVAGVASAQCAKHGWPEVPPLMAQRGDPVIVTTPAGETLGIADGPVAWFVGAEGLQSLPITEIVKAWRVE